MPSRSLSSIFDWVKLVLRKDIIHGFLLEDIQATKPAGAVVKHKLGRVPVGAFVVKGTGTVAISDFTITTITVTGSTLVTIWIF